MRGTQGLGQWIMLCAVPAIALTVAARQVYLSRSEDLSTWKGGGMGMFAAADNTLGRFLKIYLLAPTGQRFPLSVLKPSDQEPARKVVNFPSERNFRALAQSIKSTNWLASNEGVPLAIFNENGQRVKVESSVRFPQLRPAPARARLERTDIGVEVEFWKVTYDVSTRDLKATLARTFTLKD